MVTAILVVFDLLSPLVRLLGVDYHRFRAILEVKLLLDGRRQGSAALGVHQPSGKKKQNTLALSLLMNSIFGIFVASTLTLTASPLVGLTVEFSFILVMVGMMLVADYSSVLLDTADNQILQPRPVTGRTILAARIAHIAVYLGLLSFSLGLAAFVIGALRYGALFIPAFAAALLAGIMLMVATVNILYLLVMRVVNGEKLRDLILYFQIVVAVVMMGGYQLMPRLLDTTALQTLDISGASWIYFYPPTWFAGAVDFALGRHGPAQTRLLLLALGGPLLALLILAALAPIFRRALQRLDLDSATLVAARTPATAKPAAVRPSWNETLARWLCPRPLERAAFSLLWSIAVRDRHLKQRTYPMAFFGLILGAGIMLGPSRAQNFSLSELRTRQTYLLLLYTGCMLMPSSVMQLRFSNQHEAAAFYRFLPIARPGDIMSAGLKMMLARIIAPSFAPAALAVLLIWGPRVTLDVLVAFFATMLTCTVAALLTARQIPFSEKFGAVESSGRLISMFPLMILPGALGGAHYLVLKQLPYPFVALLAPLWLLAIMGLMALYRSTTWRKIATTD